MDQPSINAHFSGIGALICAELSKAQHRVLAATGWLTSKNITASLINCRERGVQVDLILGEKLDQSPKADLKSKLDLLLHLKEAGCRVFSSKGRGAGQYGMMHNKFLVIDFDIVFTGSFNFTENAENYNQENIVLIKDRMLADAYEHWYHEALQYASWWFPSERPICLLTTSKKYIEPCGSVELTWTFQQGAIARLNGNVLEEHAGSQLVCAEHDTLFELKVQSTSGAEEEICRIEVCVLEAPRIHFTVKQESYSNSEQRKLLPMDNGNTYLLRPLLPVEIVWETENCTAVQIEDKLLSRSGSIYLSPQEIKKSIAVRVFNKTREVRRDLFFEHLALSKTTSPELAFGFPEIRIESELNIRYATPPEIGTKFKMVTIPEPLPIDLGSIDLKKIQEIAFSIYSKTLLKRLHPWNRLLQFFRKP